MRIIDKNSSINEVVELILQKARYQKVVMCLDEDSDIGFVNEIDDRIGKKVVVMKYYYNKNNIKQFFALINNGVRVVVYNVSLEHFYKLQNDNNFVLNIFLPQSTFVLPYITNVESVYGDNLLLCDTSIKDYTSLIFMYEMAFNKLWGLLLQDVEVDVAMFKNIDALSNNKYGFYDNLVTQIRFLQPYLQDDYKQVDKSQLPYYIYLKLIAIIQMLANAHQGEEQYVDFCKTQLSREAIEKAHALVLKYDIIDKLKYHSGNLIKINNIILNRVKIIIKKYFNFKNIKIKKLNKIIKNQSKALNIDNLLYISYIFNII